MTDVSILENLEFGDDSICGCLLFEETPEETKLEPSAGEAPRVCRNGTLRGGLIKGSLEPMVDVLRCFSVSSDLFRLCGRAVKLSSRGFISGGSRVIR